MENRLQLVTVQCRQWNRFDRCGIKLPYVYAKKDANTIDQL